MVTGNAKWCFPPPAPQDDAASQGLARELGCSPALIRILASRGLNTAEGILRFLKPDIEALANPLLMKDMDIAADRLARAIERRERVVVYGDYDADGVTATALLVRALSALGADVGWYLPRRIEEGYGLNGAATASLAAQGTRLLVSVDCGITASEEVALAASLGMDVIVVDHHEAPRSLPPAVAVVDPKRGDCGHPFKELAAVGVAFKLVWALLAQRKGTGGSRKPPPEALALLDLVAVGTVADVVPLTGENRALAWHGLALLSDPLRGNPGLRALMRAAGLEGRPATSGHVGFSLGPRLNASGRLRDPRESLELLLTDEMREATRIAELLEMANRERQSVENDVYRQASAMIRELYPDLDDMSCVVVAGEGWHPGVIGLAASRAAQLFWRPVLVVSMDGNSGRGSGRSVPGFNLYGALLDCRDLLSEFGGHEMAAGFSLRREHLSAFRERFHEVVRRSFRPEDGERRLQVDHVVTLSALTAEFAREIETLEPFGPGNPRPLLAARGVQVVSGRLVGKASEHLKLQLAEGVSGVQIGCIGFHLAASHQEFVRERERLVDVAFFLEMSPDRPQPEVLLRDMRRTVFEGSGPLDELFRCYGWVEPPWDAEEPDECRVSRASASCPRASGATGCEGPTSGPAVSAARSGSSGARDALVPPVEVAHGGNSVVDKRGGVKASQYVGLVASASSARQILVYVRTRRGAVGLATRLRLQHKHLRVGAGFYYKSMPAGARRLLLDWVETGAARTLVCSSVPDPRVVKAFVGEAGPGSAAIVLAEIPVDEGVVGRLLRCLDALGGPPSEIHLVYDRDDLPSAMEALERVWPGRDSLRLLYLALRDLTGGISESSFVPVALPEFVGAAKARGLQCGPRACLYSLEVFCELGLVELETPRVCGRSEGEQFVRIRPARSPGGRKLDLALSVSYNQGVQERKRFLALGKQALSARGEEVVRALAEGFDQAADRGRATEGEPA